MTLGTRNRLSLGIVHTSIPCMCPVSGSEGEGENGVTAGSVARKLSAEVSSPGWASPSSFWRDKSVKRYIWQKLSVRTENSTDHCSRQQSQHGRPPIYDIWIYRHWRNGMGHGKESPSENPRISSTGYLRAR